eukprot:10274768-Heterocapsa_arctica.AAC.1
MVEGERKVEDLVLQRHDNHNQVPARLHKKPVRVVSVRRFQVHGQARVLDHADVHREPPGPAPVRWAGRQLGHIGRRVGPKRDPPATDRHIQRQPPRCRLPVASVTPRRHLGRHRDQGLDDLQYPDHDALSR